MRYHNITKDDMLNGDGLRTVLWVSGCTHACRGCHNPVTWDVNGGLPFDAAAKEELFKELEKDYISGITFSGGDPLYSANCEAVGKLIKEVKENYPDKTIWLYTGYEWEEIKQLWFVPMIDVIIDGEFKEEMKNTGLKWKGSSNQRVIDVKKTLEKEEIVLKYRD